MKLMKDLTYAMEIFKLNGLAANINFSRNVTLSYLAAIDSKLIC